MHIHTRAGFAAIVRLYADHRGISDAEALKVLSRNHSIIRNAFSNKQAYHAFCFNNAAAFQQRLEDLTHHHDPETGAYTDLLDYGLTIQEEEDARTVQAEELEAFENRVAAAFAGQAGTGDEIAPLFLRYARTLREPAAAAPDTRAAAREARIRLAAVICIVAEVWEWTNGETYTKLAARHPEVQAAFKDYDALYGFIRKQKKEVLARITTYQQMPPDEAALTTTTSLADYLRR